MTFAGINFLAVAIAAVVAWLASAGWYMSLGRIYQAAQGKTPEQCKEEMKKPGAFLPSSTPSSATWSSPGCWPACSAISGR